MDEDFPLCNSVEFNVLLEWPSSDSDINNYMISQSTHMIRSMTSFARSESQHSWGHLTWEIRSVNHRYLEPQFKLPEMMRFLEPHLRDSLRKKLNRGKVECGLKYNLNTNNTKQLSINTELTTQLLSLAAQVESKMQTSVPSSALDILRWPGVLEDPVLDMDSVHDSALESFDVGLQQLLAAREREGGELAKLISQRLDLITSNTDSLRVRIPQILTLQRQRIIARCEEVNIAIEPERMEQELLLIAQKSDVAEELDRLDTHIQEVRRNLTKGGACGRRLDFLMQELNREANTLSSKSIDSEMTKVAVELKVLIEQMREQIQNIE